MALIRMFAHASSPEFNFRNGELIECPKHIAERLVNPPNGGRVIGERDGRPLFGPAAEYVTRSTLTAKEKKRIRKMPPKPDPRDVDEEYEDLEDDEDGDIIDADDE